MNFSCPTKVGDLPFTLQSNVVREIPKNCPSNEIGFGFDMITEHNRIYYETCAPDRNTANQKLQSLSNDTPVTNTYCVTDNDTYISSVSYIGNDTNNTVAFFIDTFPDPPTNF